MDCLHVLIDNRPFLWRPQTKKGPVLVLATTALIYISVVVLVACWPRDTATPVGTPTVEAEPGERFGISREQALEITLARFGQEWLVPEQVLTASEPVVRLGRSSGFAGQIPGGEDKLGWAVQVERQQRPSPGGPNQSRRVNYFNTLIVDAVTGEPLIFVSADKPVLYPSSLRTPYSAECTTADPAQGMPRIGPAKAIELAVAAVRERPAVTNGGRPDLSLTDADLITCSGAGSGGPKPSLFWLVTVPAEQKLQRCGPVNPKRNGLGPTCWSGHLYVRVHGANGTTSIGLQQLREGPLMYDLELERAGRLAAQEGWWRIWSLLQDPSVLPRFAFALAAYDRDPEKPIPFEIPQAPERGPSFDPREDPAHWAGYGNVSFVIVGRIVERSGTYTETVGPFENVYGLWRVEVEDVVVGRLPDDEAREITVRITDANVGPRFPITLEPSSRAVLFLEVPRSFGDRERDFDLAPAAIPGSNGVIRVEDDRVRVSRGGVIVEEPLGEFLDRVRVIRKQATGDGQ